MQKLSPLLFLIAVAVLVYGMGSVDLKAEDRGASLQDVCRAPASWVYSVLDNIPGAHEVPAFLERQVKGVESRVPDIAGLIGGLPGGKGSALEQWILNTGPHYL